MQYLQKFIIVAFLLILASYTYDYFSVSTGNFVASVETNVNVLGCGNLECDLNENCPQDNVSCTNLKCYDMTCLDGCGFAVVPKDTIDEACFNDTGCTGGLCFCDGTGNCISYATVTPSPQSPGGGGGGASVELKSSFIISNDIFRVRLKQGEYTTRSFVIENNGDVDLELTVDPGEMKFIVTPSNYAFFIGSGQTKVIDLNFLVSEDTPADIYTGRIVVRSDKTEKYITAIVDVIQKTALFDVRMIVDDPKNKLPGESISAVIYLKNLGDLKPVDVTIEYIFKDFSGNIISKKSETIGIYDTLELKRNIDISEQILPGDYVLYVKVLYENSVATSSELISIIPSAKPLEISEVDYFREIVILIIIIVVIAFLVYKNRKKTRKRAKSARKNHR